MDVTEIRPPYGRLNDKLVYGKTEYKRSFHSYSIYISHPFPNYFSLSRKLDFLDEMGEN